MKRNLKFQATALLSIFVLGSTVPSFSAFAESLENSSQNSLWDIEDETNTIYDDQNDSRSQLLDASDVKFLKDSGLTDLDIEKVQNQVSSKVKVIDGYVINSNGNRQARGKWSSAAKLLLKNYNKLPGWIKGLVGYGAANSLAKTLENFSGSLETGLTIGLEALGFSGGVARKIAQGIAWALF